MSDMVATKTFFTCIGDVEICVREGEEYAATELVVKANAEFFESKAVPAPRRKAAAKNG
ncbi:hypothetical protein [Micromonospora sp. CA-246542]|uniref:hypothetical protein n=1 Tax=Micromonospora sp. CA-246542 TaxID=3239959 RepID=UPI003D950958